MTDNDLERFSHTEEPWIVSRRNHAEGGSDRISNDLIRDYFRRIDEDDDEAGHRVRSSESGSAQPDRQPNPRWVSP